jgi:hypothetical protein
MSLLRRQGNVSGGEFVSPFRMGEPAHAVMRLLALPGSQHSPLPYKNLASECQKVLSHDSIAFDVYFARLELSNAQNSQ